MDAADLYIIMDNKLPIFVFAMNQKGNVARAVKGDAVGTLVSDAETR
jgi:uridylate kinase